MQAFAHSYCSRCRVEAAHDIYISEGGYLHSLCTNCGKDVDSSARVGYQSGRADKYCSACGRNTEHIRYTSEGNYPHWFCCSCGRDIEGSAREA